MSTTVNPELRTKILATVKDGTSIGEAAKANNVSEDAIRGWLKRDAKPAATVSNASELMRLRRENQQLKETLGAILIERELAKKTSRPS